MSKFIRTQLICPIHYVPLTLVLGKRYAKVIHHAPECLVAEVRDAPSRRVLFQRLSEVVHASTD